MIKSLFGGKMFKKLIILILIPISFFSNAYTLKYIGTIEAQKYNDVWEQYFDADIDLYAGSDGDASTIRLRFDMSLDTYNYDIDFYGLDPSKDSGFSTFQSLLQKAKDWTKIARDNNANTSKDVGSCNIRGTRCKVSFRSSSGGNNISIKIYIKEDATFTLSEDTFELTPRQLEQLHGWFNTNRMSSVLQGSALENTQADDLFN
tara:strand:+ start:655 stop:1266 length:612 start_codon:yes stop_codon:yes gene_type:complete